MYYWLLAQDELTLDSHLTVWALWSVCFRIQFLLRTVGSISE